jgi:hypothetical protein
VTKIDQGWQNRAYVRKLLEEKQPELAAVLRIVERELTASMRSPRDSARPALCTTGHDEQIAGEISSA